MSSSPSFIDSVNVSELESHGQGHDDGGGAATPILTDEEFRNLAGIFNPIGGALAIMGVATNVINIRVFVEQARKHGTTSVGLLALAVFDLVGCLVMVAPFSCIYLSYAQDSPARYQICRTFGTFFSFIQSVLNHCSNWTTVYVSLERTLCVVAPLKVKIFLRPKMAVVIIAAIFVVIFTIQMIYSMSTSVVWVFNFRLNVSLPIIYEPPFATKYIYISTFILTTVLNPLSMGIVAINTIIMFYKLGQIKKWRNQNQTTISMINPGNNGGNASTGRSRVVVEEKGDNKNKSMSSKGDNKKKSMSSKDVDMLKSVTTVTCIFLVCLSTSHISSTAFLVFPGVTFAGVNRNLMMLTYGIRYSLNMINSSTNFFFYIRVSSRYKEAFATAFPRCSRS